MVMGIPDRWDVCSKTTSLNCIIWACALWGNSIAVGLRRDVAIFDAITGTRTSVFRGHKMAIYSLAFSLDGTLLLSRDGKGIFNLWDIQTGGAIETFGDNTTSFSAGSISPDNATIAFGGEDGTIYLSDVQARKLHPITSADTRIRSISFSPTDPRRLLWLSGDSTVQQWGTDGSQIGASYCDSDITSVKGLAYSSDGTRFVFCGDEVAVVCDSKSGKQVVKLHARTRSSLGKPCFSPDGKFVACAASDDIFVWNISISGAPLVERSTMNSDHVCFLAFSSSSSSLVSASSRGSVKFWPTDRLLMDSTTTGPAATSTRIRSAHLFHDDSAVVTSDSSGVVKTWDLITGICKSFSTPAKGFRDTYLAGDTLIIVWRTRRMEETLAWDVYKGQPLPPFPMPPPEFVHIKISGDGPTVFWQDNGHTEAVSMETRENAGYVRVGIRSTVHSFSFIHKSRLEIESESSRGKWDPKDMKVSYPAGFKSQFRLDVVQQANKDTLRGVGDTVTKRMVFYFPERNRGISTKVEWDGRYLLVKLPPGEPMVLDFDPVCPVQDS